MPKPKQGAERLSVAVCDKILSLASRIYSDAILALAESRKGAEMVADASISTAGMNAMRLMELTENHPSVRFGPIVSAALHKLFDARMELALFESDQPRSRSGSQHSVTRIAEVVASGHQLLIDSVRAGDEEGAARLAGKIDRNRVKIRNILDDAESGNYQQISEAVGRALRLTRDSRIHGDKLHAERLLDTVDRLRDELKGILDAEVSADDDDVGRPRTNDSTESLGRQCDAVRAVLEASRGYMSKSRRRTDLRDALKKLNRLL